MNVASFPSGRFGNSGISLQPVESAGMSAGFHSKGNSGASAYYTDFLMRSFLVVLMILPGLIPGISLAEFQQDGGAQGLVVMEAEHFHDSTVSPDGHYWGSAGASYPGYAGTDALQSLPDDKVSTQGAGYSAQSPRLDFRVNFVQAGTHYVWVRAWGPKTSSNSLHVGLDGQELDSASDMRLPDGVLDRYVWVKTIDATSTRATLEVATPGVHVVNVWMRESGTVVDRIVLTTDPAYDPSLENGGLGPAESAHGNTPPAVEQPVIDPAGGSFVDSVLVTITTATSGATIHYTLDGNDPTASSPVYTAPILVTSNTVVKARAYLSDGTSSTIATASFYIRPIPAGLTRYWSLDETSGTTFTDRIGGAVGTCTACPSPEPGLIQGAQRFDGATTGIEVPDDGAFDWLAGDRFTIEAWMRNDSGCTGQQAAVGRSETSGSSLQWWLGCDGGVARFSLRDAVGNSTSLMGTTPVADGAWHHLLAQHDPVSGEIRLYVDGMLESSASTLSGSGFEGTSPLTIGWLDDGVSYRRFNGVIDEVAIHDRILLPEEIQRHYNDGTIGLHRGYWGCDSNVRIMPLGDSITKRTGYRPGLFNQLTDAGYDVDFVGSQQDTSGAYDRDHEGHSGYTTSDIAAFLDQWLSMNPPDVILLHIGTNEDPSYPYPSSDGVANLYNIIDGFDPTIAIVQARIINKVPNDPLVTQFNDNVAALHAARVAAGGRGVLVDQESALNYVDDMESDGIHPNANGFAKMVPVWYDGLASFLPVCTAVPPQITSTPVTTASVGAGYVYQVEAVGNPAPVFSLLSAPAGMQIHPDTGLIKWVPNAAGQYAITVEVANTEGTVTQDFTLVVN